MVTTEDVDRTLVQVTEDIQDCLGYLEKIEAADRLGLFCARSSLRHALSLLGDLAERAQEEAA
jgi:hypothetical protein